MNPVKRCTCKSPFQDKRYGPGMRLFRQPKKGEDRCTVCEPTPHDKRMKAIASTWKPLHG